LVLSDASGKVQSISQWIEQLTEQYVYPLSE